MAAQQGGGSRRKRIKREKMKPEGGGYNVFPENGKLLREIRGAGGCH